MCKDLYKAFRCRCVYKARENCPIVQLDMVPNVFCFVAYVLLFVVHICEKERTGWCEPAERRAVHASLHHYISAELSIFH